MTVMMTAAMCVMAEARDLLMLFLSMEGVGLTSYVMAGYMRGSRMALKPVEAGVCLEFSENGRMGQDWVGCRVLQQE